MSIKRKLRAISSYIGAECCVNGFVGLARTIVGVELSRRAHATWRQAQDTGVLGGWLERG
jgi:hypothetical protein